MRIERGTIVGGYRVEGILGRGGMGVVYSATDLRLDRRVALKVLNDELSSSHEFVERFRREGRMQAALQHPHAVTIYEAGESEVGVYLAMRLVPGPTLALLIKDRALDAGRALSLLGQVADALDVAHAAGLVHRDVKPQNILVGQSDDAYLGDFGLVRIGGSAGVTATGRMLGTIAYLAPEVIQGEEATSASDVYAFAAMSFECLTGTVVYPRGTEAAVLYAHTNEPPPRASECRHELPVSVDALFAKALAKDPAERPKTASSFVAAIRAALKAAGAETLGPPPHTVAALAAETIEPTALPRSPPTRSRRARTWVAVGVVAGLIAALAGWERFAGDSAATALVPAPLPGAVVLGSDLSRPGQTLDCREETVTALSPECTIAQTALPGATIVVPEDGVIRRWSVRSAHGELSLAGLRPRERGASQFARSQNEFAENDGVFTFPAEMAVERGDLIGLVVIEGSGVGTRHADGAATERWLPHVGAARQPSFASGRGFEREVLLRAELVPGAKVRPPQAWVGESVKRLPPGRVLERRRLTLPNGHLVEIDVVQVGRRVVIDYRNRGTLIARMDLPGFNPGGAVVVLSVDPSTGPDGVDAYVEYVGLNSQRVRNHYYGVDMNGFVFVD
jgi:serine/threonine-protein kinase